MNHWKTHAIWATVSVLLVLLTYRLGATGAFSDAENLIVLPRNKVEVYDSMMFGKRLYVDGTWQIMGNEKDGFPKNFSQYRCDQRGNGYCQLTQTRFYKNTLSVNTSDDVKITKWDDQQIILEQTGETNCRDFVVVVDLLTKEIKGITKDTPNRRAICNETSPILTKPRISRMIDGFDLSFPPPAKK